MRSETTDPVQRAKQCLDKIKPAEFFNGCIWCWNAFRQQKDIKEVKHNTTKGWHTIIFLQGLGVQGLPGLGGYGVQVIPTIPDLFVRITWTVQLP